MFLERVRREAAGVPQRSVRGWRGSEGRASAAGALRTRTAAGAPRAGQRRGGQGRDLSRYVGFRRTGDRDVSLMLSRWGRCALGQG